MSLGRRFWRIVLIVATFVVAVVGYIFLGGQDPAMACVEACARDHDIDSDEYRECVVRCHQPDPS